MSTAAMLFMMALAGCGAEKTLQEKLHDYYQKSDLNNDHALDKAELAAFIRTLLPTALYPAKPDSDTIETAALIAEKMFDEADLDNRGKLSLKGSLLFRSPASIFGEKLENALMDLVAETDSLEPDRAESQFKH